MNHLTTLFLYFSCAIYAQHPPQWGNLKPGPYAIGYRTIQTVDYSRMLSKAEDLAFLI